MPQPKHERGLSYGPVYCPLPSRLKSPSSVWSPRTCTCAISLILWSFWSPPTHTTAISNYSKPLNAAKSCKHFLQNFVVIATIIVCEIRITMAAKERVIWKESLISIPKKEKKKQKRTWTLLHQCNSNGLILIIRLEYFHWQPFASTFPALLMIKLFNIWSVLSRNAVTNKITNFWKLLWKKPILQTHTPTESYRVADKNGEEPLQSVQRKGQDPFVPVWS